MISYKKKKYRFFLALLILAGGVYGSLFNKIQDRYVEEIVKLRTHYNHYIKYYEDSPLEQDEISYFDELDYYKIDKKHKVRAELVPFDQKDTFEIKLTDNKVIQFLKYGKAVFKYKGDNHSLTLLKHTKSEEDKFFVPFKDKTNGQYTYGAGRYLDVEYDGDKKVVLDFNLAYNPYCAYNSNYKCPIVPPENYMNTKIEAGEKAFNLQAKLSD